MPNYEVELHGGVYFSKTINVHALSEEEAIDKAHDQFELEQDDINLADSLIEDTDCRKLKGEEY